MDSEQKNSNRYVECEVSDIWKVLGKTWSLLILKNLSTKDTLRFNEIKRLLNGISSTVLSERLVDLEKEGLIHKKIYAEVPLRVEYNLTKQAKELEIILGDLDKWTKRWQTSKSKHSTKKVID